MVATRSVKHIISLLYEVIPVTFMTDAVTANIVISFSSDMLRDMLKLAEVRDISISQLIIDSVAEAIEDAKIKVE